MTSTFYKISCINENKECNIISPISEHIDFNGINPVTGQRFVQDDIDSALKRHRDSDFFLSKSSYERNFLR